MDGKTDAENWIAQVLKDPALLQSLAAAPAPQAEASSSETSAKE